MQLSHKSNFYLLDKPKTWTSQDLCTKLKKNFKFKKVGHSGTLDPNADGLMLLATNGYTKLFDYIDNTNKTYKVIAILGYSSPTLDVDSEIKKHDDISAEQLKPQIQEFLTNLVGESTQTPPIYSAIKVNGKRAYKLAREGIRFKIPERQIKIYDLTMINTNQSNLTDFYVKCSSGTYIRSLAESIADECNAICHVTKLRRTGFGKLDKKMVAA